MLRERIHRKLDLAAVREGHGLGGEIDSDFRPRIALHQREKRGVRFRRHHDRQQGVLQRVLLEDVRERGADDGAESELRQGPGRVLTGTATAEIVACQQNLRALPARLVEDEIGLGVALRVVAPVVEKLLVEPLLGDGFQEAGGGLSD